jgi:hypothetical protein
MLHAMRRIIYNDDSQGVGETRPGHAVEDLHAWVDKPLSRLDIDTYAWCIAFPDIGMHETKVGEVYGDRFDEPPTRAAAAIRELREQGTDVLHVVAQATRRHGVELVASVRMNDTHGMYLDPAIPYIPQLAIDHPEWVIRRDDGIPERALDYAVPEVRQHRLAILRELAEGWDIDGLELDFTRWAKLFRRSDAPSLSPIMTDFVGQVRAMLDEVGRQRGRRFVLGAQVLESLHLNHLAGMDVRSWIELDWLDFVIQCDFNCTNPQLPVAEFAALCAGRDCTHHVRMGNMMGGSWKGKPHLSGLSTVAYKNNPGYGGMVLTPDEARGAAANIYGAGADGIGLWNICCNMGDNHKTDSTGPDRARFQQDMIDWIDAVSTPERVWAGRRHYHFVPLYKKEALPPRNYPVNELLAGPTGWPVQMVRFPAASTGYRQVFRFRMADGRGGEELAGVLRWRMLASTPADTFAFDVNGTYLTPSAVRATDEADEELPAVLYEVDLADCPEFGGPAGDGENELGVTLTGLGETRVAGDPYLEQLEVIVEV